MMKVNVKISVIYISLYAMLEVEYVIKLIFLLIISLTIIKEITYEYEFVKEWLIIHYLNLTNSFFFRTKIYFSSKNITFYQISYLFFVLSLPINIYQ